ncbi:DUF4391 domain-containing protein [Micromonospora aurantiaca (nom. illeg.)]|uniref:DUF4391 domain-containing protein n=1 Tax=Micromonospora aurantiaca (nom. illeg.) TaxID=47850 RepID=UPI0036BC3552
MADTAEDIGVLYRWPATAAFGRTVSKTKFHEHGNVRTALREKFVADIQRITWAYKLADTTMRLHGTASVPEIQIFAIETKGGDVTADVLTAIDRSVHFPIIFEVTDGKRVRTVAAHKALGGSAPRLGPYFTTQWLPIDATRRPLPTTLDLPSLYEAILVSLLPIETRPGETVSDATGRMERVRKLRREIVSLEKQLRAELQLNRKIEIRRQIKERTQVLTELTDPAPSDRG